MLGAGRHEHGVPLAELDLSALYLEHAASFDHNVDLVVLVGRLAVGSGPNEDVDAELEPGRAVDDLVAPGRSREPFLGPGDIERLCHPQCSRLIR
jgi:hypothetical protein